MLSNSSKIGRVYFVGAGPGDPGLITLRGVECLRQADVILYDYLVNRDLLDYAPAEAERVCLGHHHVGREMTQETINARLIAAAKQGKTAVRLKGGDPFVFGRGAEETAALSAAEIPFEIVPGVTAALAAAAYAAIPITHGQKASAVALVTGHQRPGKDGDPLDYAKLADFPGTLVFYMGVHSAGEWSRALLDGGKSPNTPVAIVRRCTWPDQEIVRCTLGTLAETIAARQLLPPAVVIVGEVAELAPALSWFAARPLSGRTIMVTRPREKIEQWVGLELYQSCGERSCATGFARAGGRTTLAEPVAPIFPQPIQDRLRELGAEVVEQPVIEIGDPPDWSPVDSALKRLSQFNWIVFSSANGVRYFLGRLLESGGDWRRLGGVKIAAIGPATAEAIWQFHLRADLVPPEFRAESLAETIVEALSNQAANKRILLVRASRGREVLAEQLAAAGAKVEQVVAYSSKDIERADDEIVGRLAGGQIDWITVTSSSIARSLVSLFGDKLRQSKLASISPVTSATLRELGCEPAVEASEYTLPGLVEAILHFAK